VKGLKKKKKFRKTTSTFENGLFSKFADSQSRYSTWIITSVQCIEFTLGYKQIVHETMHVLYVHSICHDFLVLLQLWCLKKIIWNC